MNHTVTLIGLGGIGCAVARALPQTLAWVSTPGNRYVVNLVDGDVFEPHNAARQTFHRAGPKAEVIAEALRAAYKPDVHDDLPPISFRPYPQMVTPDNVAAHIVAGDIVLLAVDHHWPRRVVSEYVSNLATIVVISGSNSKLTDGTVQLYARSRGRNLTLPLHNTHHPEIATATSQGQPAHGCGMRYRDPESKQLFVVNNRVAATMMELLHRLMTTSDASVASLPDEVRLDVATLTQRPVTLRQS